MLPQLHIRHGTCVAVGACGIFIEGPPGSGKSSLALRLIDEPGYGLGTTLLRAELVADDQVVLTPERDGLWASAPAALKDLLEVRGVGLLPVEPCEKVRLQLVVTLVPTADIERLPELKTTHMLGCELAHLHMNASLPETPARLRAAVTAWLKSA